jgi:hypothetical protein
LKPLDSQEEMQGEYDEEEEEFDEYEDYQAQPARMRYESTSSQDLGSDEIEVKIHNDKIVPIWI